MNKSCVRIPQILMPNESIDLSKWSVIACDQYTSQPEYWHEIERQTRTFSSCLNLILPEVYLEDEDVNDRILKIHQTMKSYLDSEILKPLSRGFILTERFLRGNNSSRKGLVLSVDLEDYDYSPDSKSLIRPTEKTVVERIPPRLKVRRGAYIESPHIMLLIDNKDRSIIEPLFAHKQDFNKIYDFELMQKSGRIEGYFVDDDEVVDKLIQDFDALCNKDYFKKKYHISGDDCDVLQFAVGDGNHSMATAKAYWEEIKVGLSSEQKANHPARFALVEIVNIHDDSLEIEPIHRVIFNANLEQMQSCANEFFSSNNCEFKISHNAIDAQGINQYKLISGGNSSYFIVKDSKWQLPIATLQAFLDYYESQTSNIKIDYIHGEKVVFDLCSSADNIGFILPDFSKDDLFMGIIHDGVLPKKTFSMGHAYDKRFYLECKTI